MTPVDMENELNSVVVYNSKDIIVKVPSSVDRLRRKRRRKSLNDTGKLYHSLLCNEFFSDKRKD